MHSFLRSKPAVQLLNFASKIYSLVDKTHQGPTMRYVLMVLAVAGVVASALALREHYRTGESPCSINEKWDCGTVNKSPFAVVWGVPIAAVGMSRYLLLGLLAFKKAYARFLD